MFNNYSSSGGVATVYIRYAADFSNHKEGEIIAVFSGCDFDLVFENDGKQITQNRFLASNFQLNLKQLTIRPRSFSKSIYELFAHKSNETIVDVPYMQKISSDANGEAFLKYTPSNSITLWKDNEKVTNYTFDNDVLLSGLEPDSVYIADYTHSNEVISSFDLSEKTLAYFTLEIINEANVDNTNRKMYIKIPRAGLATDPMLSYSEDQVTRTNLEFNVIDGKGSVVFY